MGKRVERTHAGKTWTKARYFGFLRSALRRAFSKYPVKFQVLQAAKRDKPKNKAGRNRFEFQCNVCKGWFLNSQVEVDHINPAGKLSEYSDLPGFCERLFCEEDNLQVVCKKCHAKKTTEEREARNKKQ